MSIRPRAVAVVVLVTPLALLLVVHLVPARPASGEAAPGRNAMGLRYVAPNPSAFVDGATITRWVKNFDDAAIRAHGFQLWGALTAPAGQTYTVKTKDGRTVSAPVAVFDTWYDEYETFHTQPGSANGTASPKAHHLHSPTQTAASVPGGSEVVAFNKYTREFVDFVNKNKYFGETALIARNQELTRKKAPLAERFIEPLESTHAVMLKPSYWIVKRDRPSPMQYWKGPGDTIAGSANPKTPMAATWEQIVVVDPTGTAKPGTPYTIKVYTGAGVENRTFTNYEIVGLDRFYYFPLGPDDIKYIQGGNVFTVNGVPPTELEPGDLALLVAMHVTSDEFSDWTWQSFFWRPQPVPDAGPSVKPPFNNYDQVDAYYMMGKDGKPHIAFNPYLETPIEGPTFMDPTMRGADSNCMSCHHAAAFPTLNGDPSLGSMLQGSYYSKRQVTGTEQWFGGRVKTFFMWGLVMQNQRWGKPM